jgi:hypothetical protein
MWCWQARGGVWLARVGGKARVLMAKREAEKQQRAATAAALREAKSRAHGSDIRGLFTRLEASTTAVTAGAADAELTVEDLLAVVADLKNELAELASGEKHRSSQFQPQGMPPALVMWLPWMLWLTQSVCWVGSHQVPITERGLSRPPGWQLWVPTRRRRLRCLRWVIFPSTHSRYRRVAHTHFQH